MIAGRGEPHTSLEVMFSLQLASGPFLTLWVGPRLVVTARCG